MFFVSMRNENGPANGPLNRATSSAKSSPFQSSTL